MKKSIKHLSVIALAVILVFGSSLSAFAASVTPTQLSGNDPNYSGFTKLKVDPPVDGTKSGSGLTVTVDFHNKKSVDWVSNIPVEYVFVKGGNGGNMYHYPNGSTGDTNLIAPMNGNKLTDISHVTFYFKIKGKITIVKEVYGNPEAQGTFVFSITGPNGYSEQVSITGSGSSELTYLNWGTYTIEEISLPDHYTVDLGEQSVTLSSPHNKSKTVTFKNTYVEPTTEAPTTEAPTTEAPTTEEPTTEAPTTEEPTTEEPTTEAPTTEEPTTEAPTTEAPTTEAPTTEEPTTEEPTTEAPTTEIPTETPTEPPTELPTEVPTETPTVVVEEEETPLGAAVTFTDIDAFLVPEIPEPIEEFELLDEDVPLADALPETGQLPLEMFYGLGSLISISGIALKKGKRK